MCDAFLSVASNWIPETRILVTCRTRVKVLLQPFPVHRPPPLSEFPNPFLGVWIISGTTPCTLKSYLPGMFQWSCSWWNHDDQGHRWQWHSILWSRISTRRCRWWCRAHVQLSTCPGPKHTWKNLFPSANININYLNGCTLQAVRTFQFLSWTPLHPYGRNFQLICLLPEGITGLKFGKKHLLAFPVWRLRLNKI